MSILPKGKPLDRDPNDNPTKIFIAVLAGLSTLATQSFALPHAEPSLPTPTGTPQVVGITAPGSPQAVRSSGRAGIRR